MQSIHGCGFVVRLVQDALNDAGQALKGHLDHVMGVAYKRDIDDCRESPALEIMESLEEKGSASGVHGPPRSRTSSWGQQRTSVPTDRDLSSYSLILITTDHTSIDYQDIVDRASL